MSTLITPVLAALMLVGAAGDIARGAENPEAVAARGDVGPVYVDSTDVLYLESFPVQVQLLVKGSLPTPCHEAAFEVRDLGDSIDVLLWSLADSGQVCVQVLEPFELVIPLGSFEAADLPVLLDGEAVGRIELGAGPSEPSLVGTGWSFGFCGGYCVADLAIEGDDLVLTGRGHTDERPLYTNRGRLTPEGRARLEAALVKLQGASLDPVYGCPDCADGGAAYVELSRDGVMERIEMEFGNAPDLLAELYDISASLIDSLATCHPNGLVEVADSCAAFEGS